VARRQRLGVRAAAAVRGVEPVWCVCSSALAPPQAVGWALQRRGPTCAKVLARCGLRYSVKRET